MNKLYSMSLHDKITLEDDGTQIRRVPGGWVYTRFECKQVMMPNAEWSEEYIPTSVFIPFNDEFQEINNDCF